MLPVIRRWLDKILRLGQCFTLSPPKSILKMPFSKTLTPLNVAVELLLAANSTRL